MPANASDTAFRVTIAYDRQGTARLALEGELDIATLVDLREFFHAALEDCTRMVVDLRGLRFVDLPGVRLLVELASVAARRDCALEISGATGQVARLLDLMQVRPRLGLVA